LRAKTKRTLKVLGGLAAVTATAVGVIWWRLHGARPSVKVDYAQHMNAEVDPTVQPELERLQEIVRRLGDTCVVDPKRGETSWEYASTASPGEPGFIEYAASYREAAPLVRELWSVLSLGSLAMPAVVDENGPQGVPLAIRGSVPLLGGNIGRILRGHAVVAAVEGDAAACELSLLGLAHIAWLSRDDRTELGSLLHARNCGMTIWATTDVLARWPHLISDQGLRQIAGSLGALGEAFPLDLDGERVRFLDQLQRHFTDDGTGDGRITPEGLKYVDIVRAPMNSPEWPDWFKPIAAPFMALQVGSRRDQLEIFERILASVEPLVDTPLHQWPLNDPTSTIFDESFRDFGYRHVWASRATGVPAAAARLMRRSVMLRDGFLTVIAMELYRRDCGDWPASLEALVPMYLPSIPIDDLDGQPLRYEVRDGVPWVWGVGADLDDDGGMRPVDPDHDELVARAGPRGSTRHEQAVDADWILFPPR
jgi:hypothetical protein